MDRLTKGEQRLDQIHQFTERQMNRMTEGTFSKVMDILGFVFLLACAAILATMAGIGIYLALKAVI